MRTLKPKSKSGVVRSLVLFPSSAKLPRGKGAGKIKGVLLFPFSFVRFSERAFANGGEGRELRRVVWRGGGALPPQIFFIGGAGGGRKLLPFLSCSPSPADDGAGGAAEMRCLPRAPRVAGLPKKISQYILSVYTAFIAVPNHVAPPPPSFLSPGLFGCCTPRHRACGVVCTEKPV